MTKFTCERERERKHGQHLSSVEGAVEEASEERLTLFFWHATWTCVSSGLKNAVEQLPLLQSAPVFSHPL